MLSRVDVEKLVMFMRLQAPVCYLSLFLFFFFFNDTATTEIYTLSLHDALPILGAELARPRTVAGPGGTGAGSPRRQDRKSTRLNSSHTVISYAVFCLKKKKKNKRKPQTKKTNNKVSVAKTNNIILNSNNRITHT